MNEVKRQHARVGCFICGLALLLGLPWSVSLAQAPITPSGLNTQVTLAPAPSPGHVQYDITGGTRPGGGVNLFHSFGDFNVPNNTIANFLNNTGLPTSNILGRVTGGDLSSIYGTIQTTGFGNANLFLMNPAGFLICPDATVNVGGMVAFTSADYLRLADGARFNAAPNASADALLSIAPVAAFGFLRSNPHAITVQGSQLTVAEGTGLSLVGGNITVQGGTLTAHGGNIDLVSVDKLSNPHIAGEVVVAGSGQQAGFTPTGFATLGSITLS
jgi:filamentous hemagglutinin family protein